MPVGFVCLIGSEADQQKVLNLLLETITKHFKDERKTQGIWIWSRPIYQMKTQKLLFFMGGSTIDRDYRIITLISLIGSYLIYWSRALNDKSLQGLKAVSKLGQNILVNEAYSQAQNRKDLFRYIPKLLWVVENCRVNMGMTPTECMNKYLNEKTEETTLNQIKKDLLSLFNKRECIFLETKNSKADSTTPYLEDEFRRGVKQLRNKIMESAGVKTYDGQNLEGSTVAHMIINYVQRLNQGKIPCIHTAWQFVPLDEQALGYNAAIEHYQILFNQYFNQEPKGEQLSQILTLLRQSTMNKFHSRVPNQKSQYLKKLKQFINQKQVQIKALNRRIGKDYNEVTIKRLSEFFLNKIKNGSYNNNFNHLVTDLDNIVSNYNTKAIGQTKYDVLAEFQKSLIPLIVDIKLASVSPPATPQPVTSPTPVPPIKPEPKPTVQKNKNCMGDCIIY